MRNLINAIVVLVIAVALTGCNTIEGAGKDIKATGGAIEKAAGKAKTY